MAFLLKQALQSKLMKPPAELSPQSSPVAPGPMQPTQPPPSCPCPPRDSRCQPRRSRCPNYSREPLMLFLERQHRCRHPHRCSQGHRTLHRECQHLPRFSRGHPALFREYRNQHRHRRP